MNPELATFQMCVRQLPDYPSKMYTLLFFIYHQPHYVGQIGVVYVDSTHFGTHSGILSSFLGMKLNSVNFNLRKHGEVSKSQNMSQLARELQLPDPSKWKLRECSHPLFTGSPKLTFPFQDDKPRPVERNQNDEEIIGSTDLYDYFDEQRKYFGPFD
jgi:hypothetical protein